MKKNSSQTTYIVIWYPYSSERALNFGTG
jgi:hypothetical protein